MATYTGPTINEFVATGGRITNVSADYADGGTLTVYLNIDTATVKGEWRVYVTLSNNTQLYQKNENVNGGVGVVEMTFPASSGSNNMGGNKPVEIDSYFSHAGV